MVGLSSFRKKCCELYVHRKWPTKVLTSNRLPGALGDTFTSKLPPSIKKVIFSLSYNLGGTKYETITQKYNTTPPSKGNASTVLFEVFKHHPSKKRDPYSNSINRYQSKTINQNQLPGTKTKNTKTWKPRMTQKKTSKIKKKKRRET